MDELEDLHTDRTIYVFTKTEIGGEGYIGYRKFINNLIKHVSLQIQVHARLLFSQNC